MIASVGDYPSFFESLSPSSLLHSSPTRLGFLLLLVISFVAGAFFLWRGLKSSLAQILLVWTPSVIGSILAASQSMTAEFIIGINGTGMATMYRPDRYIGHIRIYLGLGVAMSLVFLCVYILSSRRQTK